MLAFKTIAKTILCNGAGMGGKSCLHFSKFDCDHCAKKL
jgi:hypothetical protein